MTSFMLHCALESEVTAARDDLQEKAKFKAELEKLERGMKAAELDKDKAQEKLGKRVHELRHKIKEVEKEFQESKKLRELTETLVSVLTQMLDEINGIQQMLNKSVYGEEGGSAKLIYAELKITELENKMEEGNKRITSLEKKLDEILKPTENTETDWLEKVMQILKAINDVIKNLIELLETPFVATICCIVAA